MWAGLGALAWSIVPGPTLELSDAVGAAPFESSPPETARRARGIGGLAPAGSVRDEARAYLLEGDVQRAVVTLEAATEQDPDDARLWSDLAAALLARAERRDRPEDLLQALTAVDRAWALAPDLLEVAHNRAFVFEALFLDDEARAAWGALAARAAPGSTFAATALARIAALEPRPPASELTRRQLAQLPGDAGELERLIVRDPAGVRSFVETDVVRAWAEERLDASGPTFAAATRTAQVFARVTGDRFLADALAALESEAASPASSAAARRGLAAYFEARDLHLRDETAAAAPGFERAAELLHAACEPFALKARLQLAIYEYFRGNMDATRERLLAMSPGARARAYGAFAAEIEWVLGLVEGRRAAPAASLAHYEKAREAFATMGELERVSSIDIRMAGTYAVMGDGRERWRACHRGLSGLRRVEPLRERITALFSCGDAVLRSTGPQSALHFMDTAVSLAQAGGNPAELLHARLYRMLARLDSGLSVAALDDLPLLHDLLARIPEGPLRQLVEAEVAAVEGRIRLHQDPERALALLSSTRDYFVRSGSDGWLAVVSLDRARAFLARGDLDAALADLSTGIESYERHRRDAGSSTIGFFDRSRDLFDAMVRLHALERKDAGLAFAYAERARGRDLLDRMAGGPAREARPLATIGEIRSTLGPGTVIVAYHALEERLLIWALTATGLHGTEAAVRAPELSRKVADFRRLIESPTERERQRGLARELYALLLRPIEAHLRRQRTLVVLADGPLHQLPFAALVQAGNGRYLVEDYAISFAPSASVLVHAASSSRAAAGGVPALLAVGDPSFDPREFPDLPRLPGARSEAATLAALYSGARLLAGDEATHTRFLDLAGRHPVVHFAGHGVSDLEFPERSRLALAPDPGAQRGALLVADLERLDWPATRLVVLAACHTASGRLSRGEGPSSLARPFLAAGIPAVVASLWTVDDASSVDFFRSFHRRLLEGATAAEALRRAQQESLASPSAAAAAPAAWAAFQLFGNPALVVIEDEP